MTKKELEPLLLNADQVRQLTGLSVETLKCIKDFPRSVKLERVPYQWDSQRITRNLWKRKDVEKWINNLKERW